MSSRNVCCRCNNSRSNSSIGLDSSCSSLPWYCKILKPVTFVIVTAMLAICAGHLWGELSKGASFWIIKADLVMLRKQLSTLSMEVQNIRDARDEMRTKKTEIDCVIPKMYDEIRKLKGMLTQMVSDALSSNSVKEMVKSELQTYDADKTGMPDYALAAMGLSDTLEYEALIIISKLIYRTTLQLGGKIVSTRNTEHYSAVTPVLSFLWMPFCRQQNAPEAIIQAGVLPGECWAFKGTTGSVVIRLLDFVYVTGVSLEHISSTISPAGETATAPKDFTIWGLHDVDNEDGFLFGAFTYDNRADSVQYFPVQYTASEPYELIELKIHSNSGNPDYTCIYRIRVHGRQLISKKKMNS